jgi:hypothetical protein
MPSQPHGARTSLASEELKVRTDVHAIKRRKTKCTGHILRRNCLLKHIIEVRIEGMMVVMGRRGRRSKQWERRRGRRRKKLLNDLKEKRRY